MPSPEFPEMDQREIDRRFKEIGARQQFDQIAADVLQDSNKGLKPHPLPKMKTPPIIDSRRILDPEINWGTPDSEFPDGDVNG